MREFHYFWFYLLLLAFLAQSAWMLFSRWRPPSRARAGALKAVLLALSLLAAFVVLEGVFYFFVDVTDSAMALLTSRRWAVRHLLPPGEFRHPLTRTPAPAGAEQLEVCVIGDSLTYGQGVERAEDLYASLIERRLRAAGVPARVSNYSQLGWDTLSELGAFEELMRSGPRCRILVLGYCMNDIEAYLQYPPDVAAAVERLTTYPQALSPIANRSFLVSWLYNRWVVATSPALRRLEDAVVAAYRNQQAFTAHTGDLRRFKETCDRLDVRLLVATFPHIVSPWAEYRYRDVHLKLAGFWESLGVPAIDLLAAFEKHYYRDLQASVFDSHPNELAHRIAAGEIYAELSRRMGLPQQTDRGGTR
jgi:lysophospholipase L1-like esterase